MNASERHSRRNQSHEAKTTPKTLKGTVEEILIMSVSHIHPSKMRHQYSKRDWGLICRGRELTLKGIQKLLKEVKDDEL